jgi:hypothetical protein
VAGVEWDAPVVEHPVALLWDMFGWPMLFDKTPNNKKKISLKIWEIEEGW